MIQPKQKISSKTLLIGVGNEFQHDDGIGLEIVRAFRNKRIPFVITKEQTGEGTALLEAWKGSHSVFLFDAIQPAKKAGTIHRVDIQQQSLTPRFLKFSTHGFSIFEAIELSRALEQLPTHFVVYGIEGKNFETGVGLSPEVQEALPAIIQKSEAEIYERINWKD
ncbi:MAG TPA: hydrogenase maturation protease [Nitrospiria bacterium]|jgi:hydrogenase maturation protease